MGAARYIFHEIIRDTLFEVGHLSQSLGLTTHWEKHVQPTHVVN